jgi:hypothetical protein
MEIFSGGGFNMLRQKILLWVVFLLMSGVSSFGGDRGHSSDCVMLAPGEGPDNAWTVTTVCGAQADPVSFTSSLGTGYSVHMAAADVGFG